MLNALLEIKNVKKYYGNKENLTKAIDDISFSIESGEFIGIMGSSGSGKTTLLNVISTIDDVTEGCILLSGTDITQISDSEIARFRRENLGFIFQDYNLLDTLTLHENIALALTINRADSNAIDQKVIEIADKLNIKDILTKFPYEVSGGQQQRAACARAIIANPKLILADEPTGALDSKSAQILLETIATMNMEWKATVLMVTHDAFSASYCKRILFLKDGKIFKELKKGEKRRQQFYNDILEVLAMFGGGLNET